jgi:hypothetical protein
MDLIKVSATQTNPLVYKGTMYLTINEATVAIDAATCRLRWSHNSFGRVVLDFIAVDADRADAIIAAAKADDYAVLREAIPGEGRGA